MTTDTATGAARPNPFARMRGALSTWRGRARDRRALAAMDDRALRDLGYRVARIEAGAEAHLARLRTQEAAAIALRAGHEQWLAELRATLAAEEGDGGR